MWNLVHPGHEVIGVFNAGVARYRDEMVLLLRVAERPVSPEPGIVRTSFVDFSGGAGQLQTVDIAKNDSRYNVEDPRTINYRGPENSGVAYLTSLSYLRLARSRDGIRFDIDDKPFLYPETAYEAWGIEDPRITQIDDVYYILYSAVSANGVGVGLASTKDFARCERHGLIFAPENKDAVLFPEKINGKYYALHRPGAERDRQTGNMDCRIGQPLAVGQPPASAGVGSRRMGQRPHRRRGGSRKDR